MAIMSPYCGAGILGGILEVWGPGGGGGGSQQGTGSGVGGYSTPQQQMMMGNHYNGQQQLTNHAAHNNVPVNSSKVEQTKETKVEEKEILPDVSLTRVFKWALIVLVAVALGEKIWSKLGPQLTDNFCKVLGHAQEKPSA
jgi:hypothetical protein